MSNVTSNRIKALLSKTNTLVLHTSRLLSTTSGLEAVLASTLFTLSLLHAQLSHYLIRQKEKLALENAYKAFNSPRPASTILATITTPKLRVNQRQEGRIEKLTNGCLSLLRASDEMLMFLRLFGLLQIYTWAHNRYKHPPRDPWIKILVWAQILSSAMFQGIENTAYLARKGVLRGEVVRNRTVKLIALGNKFWMTQHVLEILRLLRVKQLKWNEDLGAEKIEAEEITPSAAVKSISSTQHDKVEAQSEELKKQWQRDLVFNISWLPIRLHAAHMDESESPVTDTWFGVFGLVPSLMMLQEAWRASAQR